jgi:methyl-accepting chemotaxis protein
MAVYRRRVYLISRDFQSRFILRFVMTTTVWVVLSISLFTLIAQRKLEDVLYSPHINLRTTVDVLMPSAVQAHVASLILFTAILVLAVRALWRRLSGPLYSLKKDIVRISGGDLVGGVVLREDEEFQDLAGMLDRMRTDLRRKFTSIRGRNDELSATILDLDRALARGTLPAERVLAVKTAVERIREDLNGFSY